MAFVLSWLGLAVAARAQDPAPASEPAVVLIGIEAQRDRLSYHFDNPSSADTPFLVPHYFEQQYVVDNVWLVAKARYTAGIQWETAVGAAAQRDARADDYDTFFDPGNVVIVAGTTGSAAVQSMQVSQRADIGRAGPLQVSIGYRLRWDRFDFGVGHKTVKVNGVLISATEDSSREMTDSKIHDVLVGFRAARALGGAWHLSLSGEVSPVTLARLSVQLPDKYPSQDLVFFAKGLSASARVAIVRQGERWPFEIAVQLDHSWGYQPTAQVSRSAQSVALSAGRTW